MIWTNDPVKILGIWVAIDKKERERLNLDPIFEKAKATLELWKSRGLSVFGKILIVNSLIASLFVYQMSVLPNLGNEYLKKFDAMIKEFIWKGRAKIPMRILNGLKTDGRWRFDRFEGKRHGS